MTQKILSLILVLLLLTSVFVPSVSAEPAVAFAPALGAIPEVTQILAGGVIAIMSGIAALEIAENLGKIWDNTKEGWNPLMKDTGAALDNLFQNAKWIDATSSQAEAILRFDYYTASGSGGKKNDKLYHKAKLENGEVKINTERISEEDAVKELKNGKDIFTSVKNLAKKLVDRVSEENHELLKIKSKIKSHESKEEIKESMKNNPEIHKDGTDGYYEHYHPLYQKTHPHCWFKYGGKK